MRRVGAGNSDCDYSQNFEKPVPFIKLAVILFYLSLADFAIRIYIFTLLLNYMKFPHFQV